MNNIFERLIEELLEKEFSSLVESFRGFDFNKMKQMSKSEKMVDYASKFLPKLGQGSSRIVFGWKAGKVIKLINHKYGRSDPTEQNREEIERFVNNPKLQPYLAQIYDYDKDKHWWIVAEGVQVFQDNIQLRDKFFLSFDMIDAMADRGYRMGTFEEALEQSVKEHNRYFQLYPPDAKESRRITPKDLDSRSLELLKKLYELRQLGVDDIGRLDHWGVTTSGRIVVVDYGI